MVHKSRKSIDRQQLETEGYRCQYCDELNPSCEEACRYCGDCNEFLQDRSCCNEF